MPQSVVTLFGLCMIARRGSIVHIKYQLGFLIKLLTVFKAITFVSWFPYYYVTRIVGLTQHVFLALCSWIDEVVHL